MDEDFEFESYETTPKQSKQYFKILCSLIWNPESQRRYKANLWTFAIIRNLQEGNKFFMPNQLIGWNVQTKQENPMKSVAVNNMIKIFKKLEVRKLGVSSQAKRQLEIENLVIL